MGPLRLLIADDHEIFRAGLRWLLEAQPGWQVVAEAANRREAIAKTTETRPMWHCWTSECPYLTALKQPMRFSGAAPGRKS